MKTTALGRIALATGITALTAGLFPAPAHADDAVVERRTLPVLVEFADSAFQHPDKVKESTPETYFGAKKDSLASFFTELSRGRYRVVPAVDGRYAGPITLPMDASCDASKINTLTQEALAGQGLVRGEDYDSLSMVFPAQKTGCDWAGLGSVPGPYTWINLYGTDSGLGVVGHEFGHNLGLGHQTRSLCTDGDLAGCETAGTSAKSMMGGGGPAAGISAPEMIRAGWLTDGETVKVTASGTYTLRSLHGEGDGVRALDIPMGEDRLVVEYRHAAGSFDQDLEGARVPGPRGRLRRLGADRRDRGEQDGRQRRPGRRGRRHPSHGQGEQGGAGRRLVRRRPGRCRGRPRRRVLSTAGKTPETATPDPEHTGTDTDAGDGLPDGADGTEVQGGGQGQEASGTEDAGNLAATGGDSGTLPLAVGGAGMLVVGAGALLLIRRRKQA